ncbi:hippurate hydrolase [Pochonia chlamydosporia 170]|uniref:Hippurate hydrolase n=1 Tax=Pochonia chlamydosporia 170 TaxID=1380566 RepID=A0A179F942_METCM|nr:hippurate hydrolase [Pochonia chlamydosporia 170]OAQ62035.1 hippurate hydrolase [Pochonia chlamydosporia 170]
MPPPTSSPFKAILEKHKPNLDTYESLYRHFHQNPEISTLEHETAAKIASHLKSLSPDLDIRTGIGGTGVIAICKNGAGPTVLLRADIDALPVLEKTGLDYASTKTMKDTHLDNVTKPVMHACGHDMHITCNLAAADTLLRARQEWSGTLIFLFQPAEERACGAQAMVDDGLYDPKKHACPIPDVVLGQHVFPIPPGVVATKSGPILAAADSWRITIYGRGGHGSMPHRCIDALVIAASIVVRLQTIVSREVPPEETAVVTVGSLKAGDTVNVIGDEAVMQVNVRTVSEKWRKVVLDGIKRIVKAECEAGRCPKEPRFEKLNAFPLTSNDATVTEKVGQSFAAHFGDSFETIGTPLSGSEDFQILASAINKPSMFWAWSGSGSDVWENHQKEGTLDELPVNHSPLFAPAIHPTLDTGIDAMVVGALTFVGKK